MGSKKLIKITPSVLSFFNTSVGWPFNKTNLSLKAWTNPTFDEIERYSDQN